MLSVLFLVGTSALPFSQGVAISTDGVASPINVEAAQNELTGSAVSHLWVWSKEQAPEKVQLEDLRMSRADERIDKLRVCVTSNDEELPGPGHVYSAPVEMWSEVPENLIPRWPTERDSTCTAVPVFAGTPWRVRYVGVDNSTWWKDFEDAAQSVELTTHTAREIHIAVEDISGEIIPKVGVELTDRLMGLCRAVTSDKGEVSIAPIPDEMNLTAVFVKDGFVTRAISGLPSTFPEALTLFPAASLRGRVVDADGNGIQGAQVLAEWWLPSSSVMKVENSIRQSLPNGAFVLKSIPPGKVMLQVTHPSFVRESREIELDSGQNSIGVLELRPGIQLGVQVVDDTGRPIGGASILPRGGHPIPANQGGRCQLSGVDVEKPLELAAEAEMHLSRDFVFDPPLPESLVLRLPRSSFLSGRLVKADGSAVEDVRATIGARRSGSELPVEYLGDGSFKLELPADTPIALTLKSPSTPPVDIETETGPPGSTHDLGTLTAPSGFSVSGTVVAHEDGQPVIGATVWCPRVTESGIALSAMTGDFLTTLTGEDGSFRLSGLTPVQVVVRIDAPGFARHHMAVTPEEGEWELDAGAIELSRGVEVEVRSGNLGEPAAAMLDLRRQGLEMDLLAATLSKGVARFPHVPGGSFDLWIELTTSATPQVVCEEQVAISNDRTRHLVECDDERVQVEGIVLEAGYPADGGSLSWNRARSLMTGGFSRSSNTGLKTTRTSGVEYVEVDVHPDGRFETDRLRPAQWMVLWVPPEGATGLPIEVQIPDAPIANLRLEFSGESVEGIVIDENGGPLNRAQVVTTIAGISTFSEPDGRFVLGGLGEGVHELRAIHRSGSSDIVAAVVERGAQIEPVTLVVDSRSSEGVDVLVISAGGEPAAHSLVFVEGNNGSSGGATTDSQGRAHIVLAKPHPKTVRAAAIAGGQIALDEERSWETASRGITLTVGKTGSMRIESEATAGQVEIQGPHAWRIDALLRRIGASLWISPEQPLFLSGLPPGQYGVRAGGHSATVFVEDGEEVVVSF